MIKKLSFCLFLFFINTSFAQQDSIVNYLDVNKEITKKKDQTFYIETVVKKDSIWQVKTYNREGKILELSNFKDKNRNIPLGTQRRFFKNGIQTEEFNHDTNGKIDGVYKRWFYDGKIDRKGYYAKGNKIGAWKYYHRNGKVACTQFYDKGTLLKTILFNEEGQKTTDSNPIVFQKPTYKKGGDSLEQKISELHQSVDYHINGYIYLDFMIDENGSIVDISTVSTEIPEGLMREFKVHFLNLEDWNPAISMNRKVPYHLSYSFKFRVN